MKKILPVWISMLYIFFSACSTAQKQDFISIPVDPDKEETISLSEITDNIQAVPLELTDESLIGRVLRVLLTDKYIIILQRSRILLFDQAGTFIRQIGTMGQGLGEFTNLIDITADNKNEYLFVFTIEGRIMKFDFEGNFLQQTSAGYYQGIGYINYLKEELFVVSEINRQEEGERTNQTLLYRTDKNLIKKDSLELRKIPSNGIMVNPYNDLISYDNKVLCVYPADLLPDTRIQDTLYCFKDDKISPCLKLDFKNQGSHSNKEKTLFISNIYNSSRYIFSIYMYNSNGISKIYWFCYDKKTDKNYNTEEGFTDDIYTKEKVKIRPFDSDANKFYYLYTHIDGPDGEDANPTLYIGTLKTD